VIIFKLPHMLCSFLFILFDDEKMGHVAVRIVQNVLLLSGNVFVNVMPILTTLFTYFAVFTEKYNVNFLQTFYIVCYATNALQKLFRKHLRTCLFIGENLMPLLSAAITNFATRIPWRHIGFMLAGITGWRKINRTIQTVN